MTGANRNTINLFSEVYPYESFLYLELPYLASAFDSVIVVPPPSSSIRDTSNQNLPQNVSIDTSLHDYFRQQKGNRLAKLWILFHVLSSKYFYEEIFSKPAVIFRVSLMKHLIKYLATALRTRQWAMTYIEGHHVDPSETIFYTFWLTEITLGLGLLKNRYPKIKLVSRAHGYDLYEERSYHSYIPFRPIVFQFLDQLHLISEHGRKYISSRYPRYRSIYSVSKLGVQDPKFTARPSEDAFFRIVSCSKLVPVKRIELLIGGLKELGELHPERRFEWIHIGYGPLEEELKILAKTSLPKNIYFQFLGNLSRKQVFSFYRNNPVDVFINVSSSEGIPVTIMEAESCGIPIIATAVGGNPEIVTGEVGFLLGENPTPREIADTICNVIENPVPAMEKRANSRKNWNKNYNSDNNYVYFIKKLKKLLK
jgi:glycosyltransferase involved in cell wall biosynthesis